MRKPLPLLDRLMRKVEITPDGHWKWTGATTKAGYGLVRVDNLPVTGVDGNPVMCTSVQRASWFAHHGAIEPGYMVCRTCDEQLCINPEHLRLCQNQGEFAVNYAVGSRNGNSKLSDDDIRNIRESELSVRTEAKNRGLSPSTVHRIRSGEAWKHIASS